MSNDHHYRQGLTLSEFFNRLSENKTFQYILSGIIVVLIVMTVFLVVNSNKAKNEDLAWFQTGQIVRDFYKPTRTQASYNTQQQFEYNSDVEKYKDVVNKFNTSMPKIKGTTAEPVALFYLGKSYFHLEEYKDAHETFERLYQSYPDHFLAPISILNQGLALEDSRNYEDAIAIYEYLIRIHPEHISSAYAYYHISFCHEAMGNYDQSVQALETLKEKYGEYEVKNMADDRLKFLSINKQQVIENKAKYQEILKQTDKKQDTPEDESVPEPSLDFEDIESPEQTPDNN